MVNRIKRLKGMFRRVKEHLAKIPLVQLIYRTIDGLGNIDATHRAASVAYYAILSIFPLLLGLIAVFGFFLPSINLQDALLNFVGDNIPGAADIIKKNIANIIELRGSMGILSIVILFWGASAIFSAISLAINRAWEIVQHRPFFIRKTGELGMVIFTGILFLLYLGANVLISFHGISGLTATELTMIDIGSRLVSFLLIFIILLLFYKFIPNTKTYWRYIWPGALLAAILFEIVTTLFVFYIENIANYQIIYGSITSIISLLVWTYFSALIMILGAEFTYQYSRMHNAVTLGSEPKK